MKFFPLKNKQPRNQGKKKKKGILSATESELS